jgi:AraC family transcriptional regulator
VSLDERQPAELGLAKQTAAAGISVKEFRQQPHRRLPWHDHEHASICFVVSGSYTEHVGAHEWECPAHTVVTKPAGERHADRFGSLGSTCLLVEIRAERLAAIQPFAAMMKRPTLVHNPMIAALGHRLYGEFVRQDAFSPLAMEGLTLEVLAEAARVDAEEPGTRCPPWLQRARDVIHDSFEDPITMSSVADAVGVHPSRLARMFRKHYHSSIGEYVRGLRIERAAHELAEGAVSLSEIGLRAGFYDQSHFSRVFKAHTGQTPSQFRATTDARSGRTRPPRSS